MATPEQCARQRIDELLQAAGWKIQDCGELNLRAALGVAVREFQLRTGAPDYLLFVERRPIGAIEAKPIGTLLSGVERQSQKYGAGLPDLPQPWPRPLPFLYESTGDGTYFTNGLDPDSRSRRVFAFHQPKTLAEWIREPETLRTRLRTLPPLVTTELWEAQIEAITNLERSLAEDHPRSLNQMASGSGKTFTAVGFVYRLLTFTGSSRIFLGLPARASRRRHASCFTQHATPVGTGNLPKYTR